EIQASTEAGIPRGEALAAELDQLVADLTGTEVNPDVLAGLINRATAVRENRTVTYHEAPAVYVSRTSGDVFIGEPPALTRTNDDALGLRAVPSIWYIEDLYAPGQASAALTAFPQQVADLVQNMTDDQMLIHEKPGEWNMRDLLRHLYLTQELVAGRVEQVLAEANPTLKGLAVWAMADQGGVSGVEFLARYRASREQMLARLQTLQPQDWWRPCFHDEFGPMTLLHQVVYFTRHERSHVPQMYAIYKAATA
ncbi:MAG: DinB family protein, partial [Anaerolineae bacterium]|nr:DinB family protein [Anaerolineae bacterium]